MKKCQHNDIVVVESSRGSTLRIVFSSARGTNGRRSNTWKVLSIGSKYLQVINGGHVSHRCAIDFYSSSHSRLMSVTRHNNNTS